MDEALIAAARTKLYSGVISDVLDSARQQAPGTAPENPSARRYARAVRSRAHARSTRRSTTWSPARNPYELEIALIDSLQPDDVAVMACPGENRIAPWGELLTTASRARRAAGCVTDGLVRDVRLIREMRFPVFAGAIGPLDSKGRGEVKAIDVPVECGGVPIAPGDWIFGDVDGVVVIPEALCEQDDRALAGEGARREHRARRAGGRRAARDGLRPPRNSVARQTIWNGWPAATMLHSA